MKEVTWDTEEILRFISNDEGLYIDIVLNHSDAENIFSILDMFMINADINLNEVDWDYVNKEVIILREL